MSDDFIIGLVAFGSFIFCFLVIGLGILAIDWVKKKLFNGRK